MILTLSAWYNYHVFTGLMSELQKLELLKALSKCGLNYLRLFGMALIYCLTDLDGSKERDKVRLLPNLGELDLLHLIFCLICRRKNSVLFSSFQRKGLSYFFSP